MTENAWAKIIGPCYTTASLARVLGWSEAQVFVAAEDLRVLTLCTDDGEILYPAFQVHNGRIVDGLQATLHVLHTGTQSRWTWAQWLNAAIPDDDPARHIDALIDGRLDDVLRDARHDAWTWNS